MNDRRHIDHIDALAEQLIRTDPAAWPVFLDGLLPAQQVALAIAIKDHAAALWHSDPQQTSTLAHGLDLLAASAQQPLVSGYASWTNGLAALANGDMERANTALAHAVMLFQQSDQVHSAAAVQVARLLALAMLGQYEQANQVGIWARDVFLRLGDGPAAGRIEQNLGNIALRRGQYALAEQHYQAAFRHFVAAHDRGELARVRNNLAHLATLQYRFREAERLYTEALADAEAAEQVVTQAEVECNLGNLALFQGRYHQALELLERSRRRYADLGMPHESLIAELELADAYLELNLVPEASHTYERCTHAFAGLGMQAEQARALVGQGRTYTRQHQVALAQQAFAQAHQIYAAEQNSLGMAMVALSEAFLALSNQQYADAIQAAAQARPIFAAAESWERALLADWVHAEALRLGQQYRQAAIHLEQTLAQAQDRELPHLMLRCQITLGLATMAEGQHQRAHQMMEAAVVLIEQLRAPLAAEEVHTAFVADKLAPYETLIQLALETDTPDLAQALAYNERSRSQALVAMLRGSIQYLMRPRNPIEADLMSQLETLYEELNWFYTQMQATLTRIPSEQPTLHHWREQSRQREQQIQTITHQLHHYRSDDSHSDYLVHQSPRIDQIQEYIGADTTVISYTTVGDEVLAFVLNAAGLRVYRQLTTQTTLNEAITQLRFQTDTLRYGARRLQSHLPQLARRSQHYLQQLYTWLIEPLKPCLDTQRLVIIPHRMLHYVPFQALYNGQKYLIEQYEISYSPSIAILLHCLQIPIRPLRRSVLVGVPDQHAPLAGSEVEQIAVLFEQPHVLIGDQASRHALRQAAADTDLLHIASHGQFRPDNPLFSAIRLADGWLTVREAYSLDLHCQLVTLSACETGVHAIAPGDELIGMARGFIAAGTPTLLASLWHVDDGATTELMQHVYTGLSHGLRPAVALRQAQCAQLAQQPHPFFWAPFHVIGRW